MHLPWTTRGREKRRDALFSRLFHYRPAAMLGIDIGPKAVQWVELERRNEGCRVRAYGVEPLPPGAMADKRIADEDAVGAIIEQGLRRYGVQAKEAVAAVPCSAVISKVLTVPHIANDAEMANQIQLEAANRIPFPLDELHFDFEVLGASEQAPDRVDVLLVASRNEHVDTRAAVLERAGLKPRAVDVEPYALEHAFALLASAVPDAERDKIVGIVDLGAMTTLLTVLRDGKAVYTREQPFDAGATSADGAPEATQGLESGSPAESTDSARRTLPQRINRALQYCFSTTGYDHVDHLMLAGERAEGADLAAFVQGHVAVPVTVADPFAALAAERPLPHAPALTLACGLALRGFA